METKQKEFTFKFTEIEANVILNGLVKLPFEQVSQLINNIQEQAAKQNEEIPESKSKK